MENGISTSTRNYGMLTDISKGINYRLGDRSGRTVSMRTAHGLKALTNSSMSDDVAEDVTHLMMIGVAGILISSNGRKNQGLLVLSVLLLMALFFSYYAGKE